MKLITANKLNRLFNNGIKPVLETVKSKIGVGNILTTKEQVEANTNEENVASALVTAEIISKIQFPDGTKFYLDVKDGKRGYNTDPARGADTFRPFKQGGMYPIYLSIHRSETIFIIDTEKFSFDYSWPDTGSTTYPNNVQVAGSNDEVNWTEIFNAGASKQGKSGNSGLLDVSAFKYLKFYSTTESNNYLAYSHCNNFNYE